MAYCDLCSYIVLDKLDNQHMAFHRTPRDLRASAEAGCSFCRLCWAGIQRDNVTEQIDKSINIGDSDHDEDLRMWLFGMLRYAGVGGFKDGEPGARILVFYGHPSMSSAAHMETYLSVYSKPDEPAATRFRGRFSTLSESPELHMPLIQSWLHNCNEHHRSCTVDTSGGGVMPTRVLDVGDPRVGRLARLVTTHEDMLDPYLALSYCWGPGTDTYVLNEHTLDHMLHGIDDSVLVQTHRETLELARALGIQFVWIDALCIIQGNPDDWVHESERMAHVYGNATLTVIAGRSADARDGFISNDLQQAAPPCAIPVSSSNSDGLAFASMTRSRQVGAVDTRAWCFQEKLLALKAVTFGKEQISWQCRATVKSEDGFIMMRDGRIPFVLKEHAWSSEEQSAEQKEKILKSWYTEILTEFTPRKLSNPLDVFAAIYSVAQLAQKALGSRFLSGLFECDLVRGLLWKARCHTWGGPRFSEPVKRPTLTRYAPAQVNRAPSWSWAAVEGPVAYRYDRKRSPWYCDASLVKVRPQITNPDLWAPPQIAGGSFLKMATCELRLVGRLAAARLPPIPAEKWCNEESPTWMAFAKVVRHGHLLIPEGEYSTESLMSLDTLEHVVAVGVFDIQEEANEQVWCLPLIAEEGLMLWKDADGHFHRRGWFKMANTAWFDGFSEQNIILV
ncbi:HET-domain-containing protein [Thozetella sp. PMI_491]|nr:HET-domain-containing protein [Thozetella sp. PMI_491]